MSDASQQKTPAWTPPYIAWRTLLNLIERLETDMPPQIDRTFLKGSNQSNGQTMNALKSLDLIGDEGAVTPALVRLVEAGAERPAAVRKMLETFYPEPAKLGTMNATQQQLDKAFEDYGVTGSTLRKAVSFYLKAAAYAKMPLSPHFKTPSKSSGAPRKRRPRTAAPAAPETNGKQETPGTALSPLQTRYIEMLMKRVEEQDDLDTDLLDRIESLLAMSQGETEA